jgi:hypothetical protein
VTCRLEAQRHFECEVPEGTRNLRLRMDGFVPQYFWDVPVAAGKVIELPAIRLSTGASIAGFVGRPQSVKGAATVVLRTLDAENIEAGASGQFSAPVTGVRGFFQLVSVPPGDYLIRANLGDLVSAARQVSVQRDDEAWLPEPLALRPPVTLELAVSPPTAPGGDRWRATLMHQDGALSTPIAANVVIGADGTWHRPGLPAGSYRVGLSDAAGNRRALQRFELPSSQPVAVIVQERSIHGTVRLGTTPLEAKLTFGRGGPVSVVLASDEHGEFAGELPLTDPEREDWPVVIESSKPPLRRTLAVRIPTETTDATVDLMLADTLLHVDIVDAAGNAWNEKTTLTAINDKDGPQHLLILPSGPGDGGGPDFGVFTFRGLSEGLTRVMAKSVGAASEEAIVDVKAGTAASAHLVMRETLSVTGTVISTDGIPVPAAMIRAMPLLTPFQGMAEERSTGDGRFELRLPRTAREIGLSVAAGGFAYQIARVTTQPGEELRLVLRRTGGTLRLTVPASVLAGRGTRSLFVFRSGHVVNTLYLRPWAELNGGGEPDPHTLVVPQMEAGPYSLCLFQPGEVLPVLARGSAPPSCASGQLAEGGELSLALAADAQ